MDCDPQRTDSMHYVHGFLFNGGSHTVFRVLAGITFLLCGATIGIQNLESVPLQEEISF